jgi:DNA repair photolyase
MFSPSFTNETASRRARRKAACDGKVNHPAGIDLVLFTHPTPMSFTDADLERFLDEALPGERMAAIETALRADDALRRRLSAIVGRRDAGMHSLGAVWRRHRLSCPTREQLGSHLLGVLEPGLDDYLKFHIEVACCRYCQASLADLRDQHAASDESLSARRRKRYFQSSAGYLSR